MPTKLLSNAATTTSAVFPIDGRFISLVTSGDFGSGSVTVEVSPDQGLSWIPTDAKATGPGVFNFAGGDGLQGRLRASGCTSVDAWVTFGN